MMHKLLQLTVIFLISTTNLLAQNLTVKVEPPEKTVAIGETFTVDVFIQNVTNFGAFQFDVVYSTDVVHADAAQMGAFLGSTSRIVIPAGPDIDNDNANGKLTYGGATFGASAGPNGNGVLATLTFSAQNSGNSPLELQNVQASDINGQALSVQSIISGQVTVSGGEESWENQASGTENTLFLVDAVSDQVAWIAGGIALVLRTTDGGATWSNVWNSDAVGIYCVEALNENTALVGAYSNQITDIYRTTNGGASWTKVYEHAVQSSGFIKYITMFNQSEGMAVGDPIDGVWTVLKTTNGGITWQQMPGAPAGIDGEYCARTGIIWLNHLEGWFGVHNRPKAFHTSNGGASWTEVSCSPLSHVRTIDFNRDEVGIGLAASDNNMAKTTNNGVNWQEITPPATGFVYHIVFHQGAFWALIDKLVYKSSDNGLNWELQTSASAILRFVSFTADQSRSYGWAVGDNGTILKYVSKVKVAIREEIAESVPTNYKLWQNYPNPFNPRTNFRFALKAAAHVKLEIYNTKGQKIAVIVDQLFNMGEHEIQWNASDVASGVYICKFQVADAVGTAHYVDTKKIVLMK